MACAPIYFAFAILVISYGRPLCEPCTSRSESLAYRCDGGLSEGYWLKLCQLSLTSMDQCSATVLLSTSVLAVEGLIGICAAYIAWRYRIVFYIQSAYRKTTEATAMSLAHVLGPVDDPDPEFAAAQHRLGARLVTEDDYMRLPGLLQLYRGHGSAVLCVLMARLRVGGGGSARAGGAEDEPERMITGGLDGSIRVWDMIEGTCLSVWRAAGPVNALCAFPCKGPMRARHRQSAVPLSNGRAEWTEQCGQFFQIPAGEEVALWIRVFRRRPDTFRAAAEAGKRPRRELREHALPAEEGEEGKCCYLELVGGCYFVLSEAVKVATRSLIVPPPTRHPQTHLLCSFPCSRAAARVKCWPPSRRGSTGLGLMGWGERGRDRVKSGVFAQAWWRLRDQRKVRPRAGRPGSHFEDEWDEVPATGAGVSSESKAIEDERAGRGPAGSVLVKVEVQEGPSGREEEAGGGGGEEEEEGKEPRWPRLFVCVVQLELAKGARGGAGTEVLCVVEAQTMARQRVFSATGASVTMWDPASGRVEASFPRRRPPAMVEGHPRRVSCIAVARVEGRERLFTGAMDGSVIMWDVSSGKYSTPAPRTPHLQHVK
jgi:hypothetical protein